MNLKTVISGSLIGASLLAAPSAFANWTGNVGATSKYLFRGIAQTGTDASVQGGLDYTHDKTGLYAGTWASNVGFGGADGGSEMDIYAGWSKDIGGGFTVDLGALYYWYPSEDENGAGGDELSTLEVYGGFAYGPFSLAYYYADECNFFVGDGNAQEAAYVSFGLELPITDSLAFTASFGHYSGDEIERFLVTEDSYIDYSIGLSKSLDGGFGFTFQLIDTDIEVGGVDDDLQAVVGFSKAFDL